MSVSLTGIGIQQGGEADVAWHSFGVRSALAVLAAACFLVAAPTAWVDAASPVDIGAARLYYNRPFVIGDTPARLSGTWTCDDPAAGNVTLTPDEDVTAPPAYPLPVTQCPEIDDSVVAHPRGVVTCAS